MLWFLNRFSQVADGCFLHFAVYFVSLQYKRRDDAKVAETCWDSRDNREVRGRYFAFLFQNSKKISLLLSNCQLNLYFCNRFTM